MSPDHAGATSARDRPSRLTGEARREQLLDVAAQLVVTRGVEAVTMEGVAAAAGVSKGLGYAYFDNRADLIRAVLGRELADLRERTVAAIAAGATLADRIRGAVHVWFDVVEERGGLLGRLLNATQLQPSVEENRRAATRSNEEFWARMAERDLGIPHDRAVAASAILLAGLAGVLDRWRDGDDRTSLEDTYVALAMGGLQGLAEGVEDEGK